MVVGLIAESLRPSRGLRSNLYFSDNVLHLRSWKKRARRDPCKTTRPIHLVKLFTDSFNTSNL